MVTKSTVLITGAGASVSYGFPTGEMLIKLIEDDADLHKDWVLLTQGKNANEFREALKIAKPPSIDTFLANRSEFAEIGKYAIAKQLLQKQQNLILSDPNDDWYRYLSGTIQASFRPDTYENIRLSIITPNYDTSFEEFVFKSLKQGFGWTEQEFAEKIKYIPINHVHGVLNPQSPEDHKNINKIFNISRGINLVHEKNERSEKAYEKAQITISQADEIYFLGFGYHSENLKNLGLSANFSASIKGSSFGMTDNDKIQVKRSFNTIQLPANSSKKTLEFMREYVDLS